MPIDHYIAKESVLKGRHADWDIALSPPPRVPGANGVFRE